MFLDKKTSIKIWTILNVANMLTNDFRGTGLERTLRLALDAWLSLVIRTVKPWNSIQIGEEEGQFLEALVDSFYPSEELLLVIMQQSMTSFSTSFVFKGREIRSCYGINFLSESATDFRKSYFWAQK